MTDIATVVRPLVRGDIKAWMHTWHGRSGSPERERSILSIHESDLGDFEICEQPEGVDRTVFYLDTLRRLRHEAPFLLRLEDDILVNRHIIHNILKWKGFNEPHFGAGWLSVPSNYAHHAAHTGCGVHGTLYRNYKEMNFGGGVILPSRHLTDSLLADVEKHMREMQALHPTDFTPVRSLSNVMGRLGLRAYYHFPPSLVFMDLDPPSYPGRYYPPSSLVIMRPQDFRIDWKA